MGADDFAGWSAFDVTAGFASGFISGFTSCSLLVVGRDGVVRLAPVGDFTGVAVDFGAFAGFAGFASFAAVVSVEVVGFAWARVRLAGVAATGRDGVVDGAGDFADFADGEADGDVAGDFAAGFVAGDLVVFAAGEFAVVFAAFAAGEASGNAAGEFAGGLVVFVAGEVAGFIAGDFAELDAAGFVGFVVVAGLEVEATADDFAFALVLCDAGLWGLGRAGVVAATGVVCAGEASFAGRAELAGRVFRVAGGCCATDVASIGFVFCLAVFVAGDFAGDGAGIVADVADFFAGDFARDGAAFFVCAFGSTGLDTWGELVAVFAGVLGLRGDAGAADTVGV